VQRAFREVEADPRTRSLHELRSELHARDRDRRVRALVRIRRQIETAGLRRGYFALARRHVAEPDSTCRWQATIVIGEYIPSEPAQVWVVAKALAKSSVADVRMACATVLLEHLLEFHPATMIPKCEAELADVRFRKTLGACSNFGRGGARRRIQRLLERAGLEARLAICRL
jgi:hypothetical protein